MEVRIVGKPKEIAALVVALQGQRIPRSFCTVSDAEITAFAEANYDKLQAILHTSEN